MGEEDEVKQGMGSKIANTAKEQGKEAVKNQGKKAAKKIASKFSKKFAQKAASASMKGPMMILMLKILVVILIIMAIIGIIMFVVTMPGMIMDKLKGLAKAIGNAIASWFGADSTELAAEDTKVYEILTYLEQMGYDLKGEGFITTPYTNDDVPDDKEGEWEGDKEHENTGVIRSKEDESVVKAESLFIYNYLISDNYVYTCKNFNLVTEGEDGYKWWSPFAALGARFLNLFGNTGNAIWGEGLISIWNEGSELGTTDGFYGNDIIGWNNVSIDAKSRTLSIRRGWGSNKMVYSLDGWTGRYGMPLEFLLSVHMATKMPDLAYDMTQAFGDTEINIILHPLDNVKAISGYKKDYETTGTENSEYITYGEMKKLKGEGWSPTDSWTLSKEEAMKIIKLGVKSPDNCTHTAKVYVLEAATDNGDGWIFDPDNKAKLKGHGGDFSELDDLDAEYEGVKIKDSEEKFKTSEAMVALDDKSFSKKYNPHNLDVANSYHYSSSSPVEDTVTEEFNGHKWAVQGECGAEKKTEKFDGGEECRYHSSYGNGKEGTTNYIKYCSLKYKYNKTIRRVTTRIWYAEYEGEETEFVWTTYRYDLYEYDNEKRDQGEKYVKTYMIDYIVRYKTDEELKQGKPPIMNADGTINRENVCSSDPDLDKCCESCRKYVKKAMSKMKDANDPEFDTYTPYIANVTNHWYRNVYFTTNGNQNFVQVDEEYEALMGERWTLYETDDNGQYVLYELNDDGTISDKVFNGTQQDANEKGVPVVKKAETIKITDTDANGDQLIDWVKNGNVWSAYKLNDKEVSTGWQPVYEGSEDEIEKKIFYNITTKNDVVQVEEGQRTATNSKIRNMFLNNTYFRYDGSPETADVIYELRKKISPSGDEEDRKYGPLSESDLNVSVELDTDEDGEKEKYEAKDYAGRVELTQDSLAAFSMLENTHTLDADFIYKDFKELVVELGYFTKEELSDETPRIFAWLIPEIGSGGYPIASLDKKENEYGTQAHSKADYEANMQNTIQAIVNSVEGEPETPPEANNSQTEEPGTPPDPGNGQTPEEPGTPPDPSNAQTPEPGNDQQPEPQASLNVVPKKRFKDTSTNIVGQIASLHATPISNLKAVGAISNVPSANYNYNQTNENPSKGTKTGELTFNGVNYECWHQTGVTCTLYSFAFVAHAYTGESFESYIKEVAPYWAPGLIGNAFEVAGVEGIHYGNSVALPSIDECAELISGALAESKPVYFYSGFASSAGRHAIVLLGASSSGKILYYNPWPGTVHEYGAASDFATNLTTLLNTDVHEDGGQLYSFFIPDEIPAGATFSAAGNPYVGFEGGEAVVSPVTGILLEYGTYEKGKIDPLTEKESRVNVDFKYSDSAEEEKIDDGSGSPSPEPEPDPEPIQDVIDYVGYAKIMILDTETYLELENQMKSSAPKAIAGMKDREGNAIQSLVDKDGNYLENSALKSTEILTSDDESKKWSDDEITLYGYKEFAELYSEFGVAGNIVFIDGFKCELPPEGETGTEQNANNNDQNETKILDGEDIDLTYFSTNTDNDEFDKNLYVKEERYNLSSLDATNKLNNENDIKAKADSLIKVGDKLLIKEGTIIGRTMTNDEVMKEREANGIVTPKQTVMSEQQNGNNNSAQQNEESATQIVGNYLRIIMRDEDDTVVENVEEYFKLDDEGGGGVRSESQEYQALDGDLELLANLLHHEGCAAFFTSAVYGGDSELGTAASRVTGYVLINRALSDYGGHGTTIREQILAPGQYSTAYDVTKGEAVACEECLANAEWCLTYDCSSVTNPDGDPMPRGVMGQSGWCQCHNGKFNCWWWVDTNKDGNHTEYTREGAPFDTFYCE